MQNMFYVMIYNHSYLFKFQFV